MNLRQQRQDITLALAGVTGVHASEEKPTSVGVGAAWPVWVRSRPATQCIHETDWDLVLVVGTAGTGNGVPLEKAEDNADLISEAVRTAPQPMVITMIEPGRLAQEDGGFPVLRFRIHTVN